jgi:hypothetical protein
MPELSHSRRQLIFKCCADHSMKACTAAACCSSCGVCCGLQKRVNAAMAEARAERSSAPAMLQLRVRYFDMPGSKGDAQGRAGLPPPGTISNDLAEALGKETHRARRGPGSCGGHDAT